MNPKRVTWLLLSAVVLLLATGGAAIYVPYQRERAALDEFERLRVLVERPGIGIFVFPAPPLVFNLALDGRFGEITVEHGGPAWLRSLIGDDRMRSFDRVSSAAFHHRLYVYVPDVQMNGIPSTFTFDTSSPMPDESKEQIVPLLLRLRSIDELSLDDGLLNEAELLELHRRFPAAKISIRDSARLIREWTPPPR